jgi:FKBP-type peptidyl-prolyl cis-trans isomerase SlyD
VNRAPRGKSKPRGGVKPKASRSAPLPDLAIAPDLEVTVAYRLFDEAGVLHDEVTKQAPLRYIHGYAQVIPGLEEGLAGARRGQSRTLELGPDEAFGERDPEARFTVARDEFPDPSAVAIGDELVCEAPDGGDCAYRVVEVTDDEVVADQNHPLAGQRVRFEIDVLLVRRVDEATLARAAAEMDERIEYADSMGYSGADDSDCNAIEVGPGESLVQLRRPPKSGSRS